MPALSLVVLRSVATLDEMEDKGMNPPPGGAYPPQGGAYPPQGVAYPPQGGAYPPQGMAYPPQGGPYPPQGGVSPPQPGYTGYNPSGFQPGYDPAQPGYNTPPPSYYPQATQQASNTVVVVQSQPKVTTAVFTPVGDYYYTISVVLTFLCFFCGSWWSLCCTIPAIFVASAARDAAARGDLDGARRSGQTALGLNIAAVVFYVVIWALIIGLAAGLRSTCGYYYSGYTYGCYY